MRHTGDNLSGQGEGDDEQIFVNLHELGPEVAQIYICVNIYTSNRTFSNVARPFCRVIQQGTGEELCRYELSTVPSSSGLIISRFVRVGEGWEFHALGLPSGGRTFKDSLSDMIRLFQVKQCQLQRQGSSSSMAVDVSIVRRSPQSNLGEHGNMVTGKKKSTCTIC